MRTGSKPVLRSLADKRIGLFQRYDQDVHHGQSRPLSRCRLSCARQEKKRRPRRKIDRAQATENERAA